ncbi:hypothetical protein [Flavobacterium sp. NKUCC04_CG]|uniref:hypothetical protein n=1 Tax=Flavobacterium sp. NKUCC04_CG TaxID=2842121 RepID=UPI001C5B965E|nr:hypothetical protein [Flavobacterium sp. NKUCC04_CG]MBW3518320.1 hypothetical protein [Flavobacterium sp. NKUCC04_CG]
MKKYLLFICCVLPIFAFAQIGEYGNFTKNRETFIEYKSKNGDVLKLGDTLILGKASDFDGYRYLLQINIKVHATHGGKKVVINKMRVYGNEKTGFNMWFHFKGFGWTPLDLDYENALEAGEIINPKGKISRVQAIDKLKESKELLDLGVISEEEYDKIKLEMSTIIKE